jgi:hypothetical protein
MCNTITILLLFISPVFLKCQITVSQQVFASGGSGEISHSGTLGETVIFGGKDNFIVCQGFQTGIYYFLTDVSDIINTEISWEFYPVPAVTGINLRWSENSINRADLSDITGKTIKFWNFQKGETSTYLDLTEVPSGQYILSASDEKKGILKSSRLVIQK